MIILLGLIVLIGAVVVGVAAVAANTGELRTSTGDFAVFDYQFTASAGEVFLYGTVIGAAGALGLVLLLTGLWRTSRRGSEARRELRRSRREVAAARRGTAPPQAPPVVPPPAGKPVWSPNRFLRRPSGAAPMAGAHGKTQAPTTT
ncbi:hypothetical protein [Nocardia amikacinitolerans]|uniref:hypothetical protein n=1 Tax=Nocardia amikacinitolerans TaxID=756689 RepID=UPI0020A291B5|nr:hypothetical protein [Nocardia amikacinitolerans]MCP2292138.1 hypothetical protein [Nocardia amikacinitolerans]